MAGLEFWFEFASTYSYLSVMRIEKAAAAEGVDIAWRPFLLGPIFEASGWTTSPFNIYPAKGRYMVRDIERIAASRGLRFALPDPFPANGLAAARLAVAGVEAGWCPAFTRAVFTAQFADGADISDAGTLEGLLTSVGVDASDAFARAQSADVKDVLRRQTERAQELGIFGAPSFTTVDGELFWGDDRLEQALQWAKRAAA
jgi:2-hydroxychromene-2-carboxylate isomerase